MKQKAGSLSQNYHTDFNVFHELMTSKVKKLLLVFSPYDAFLLEQGDSLASRIVNEYRGLNLSHPPRLSRASTGKEALDLITRDTFDLVITMPQVGDMDCLSLARELKVIRPELPVILLAHDSSTFIGLCEGGKIENIDRSLVWSADPDFLVALVKNIEDQLNAEHDTQKAMVRVIILVEDSPYHLSTLLPIIYREIVRQTQAVMDESLNAGHRLLKMRARPKVLVANDYEEALALYEKFKPYVFGILSDARIPKKRVLNDTAGIDLLKDIRKKISDLPLLLLSTESANCKAAEQIPAGFIDKNSPNLADEIHLFFLHHLGFGDFVFRGPDGGELHRASSLGSLEHLLLSIPEECLLYHAERNHFSNWVMARTEVNLAYWLRKEQIRSSEPRKIRRIILSRIHRFRKIRQQGVIGQFSSVDFDPGFNEFTKIGQGSIGGKGLGLAFMNAHLVSSIRQAGNVPDISVKIPNTLVISTDGFDSFMAENHLSPSSLPADDQSIAELFLRATMPQWLQNELAAYLAKTKVPLTVRSSNTLEDSQFRPYAGLFRTYMIPNSASEPATRLEQLICAIKLVYASTFYEEPRAYTKSTHQPNSGSMAVIVQHLVGNRYGDFYYPAISGIAQSHNFYPVSYMKPGEGIASIALGLGKIVVEGERCLRFSPKYPNILPQFSSVDAILANSQHHLYALRIRNYPNHLNFFSNANLEKREVTDCAAEYPVQLFTSTYFPDEHQIRDIQGPGIRVVTFASLLKHNLFHLPELLSQTLRVGRQGMGREVEIEFAVTLRPCKKKYDFFLLQIRPMAAGTEFLDVKISAKEIDESFCFSNQALGNGSKKNISDIIFVKQAHYSDKIMLQIGREIGLLNNRLLKQNRSYILIGPGRWGSADPWLGIPVKWQDISGAGVMVELQSSALSSDPSQGTHFFHNITSMNIFYFTVDNRSKGSTKKTGRLDMKWLHAQPIAEETQYVRHIRLPHPVTVKTDGRKTRGVMLYHDD